MRPKKLARIGGKHDNNDKGFIVKYLRNRANERSRRENHASNTNQQEQEKTVTVDENEESDKNDK